MKSPLFVITGSTANSTSVTIGKSKVVVPAAMYKVLVWCDKKKLHAEYIYTEHWNTVEVSKALCQSTTLVYNIESCPNVLQVCYISRKIMCLFLQEGNQCDAVVCTTLCQ